MNSIVGRWIFKIATSVLLFVAAAANAQWTVTLNLTPNPSPYLSDWSSRQNTASIVIINASGESRNVKILAEIEHNGKLIAYTNPDKVEVRTIPPGQRDFFGEAIVPMSAMHFEDNIDQSTQRTGRIPDGTVCIHVKVVDAATLQLLAENRQCALIVSYVPPYLLLPEDGAVLCKLGEHNVIEMNSGNPRPIFRWTPLVPAPSFPVRYHFEIFEVFPGQSTTIALQSARPVFERDLLGLTELMWPVELFYPEVGKRYIWRVRAADPDNQSGDWSATPFSFTVVDECSEGGIDTDGDGIPDINGYGEPIKYRSDIKVKITKADPSPLDPEKTHEFSGQASSPSGGPFMFRWFYRELGAAQYKPLSPLSNLPNVTLASGMLNAMQTYQFGLRAEKNGKYGWDAINISTGAGAAGPGGSTGGDLTGKQWDEGASQSEIGWSSSPDSRAYVAGRFAFLLDGSKLAGLLENLEGGNIKAEPVGEFSMQVGLGMPQPVFDWIQDSWNNKHIRKNGAIILADYDYSEKARREFHNALISEIQMPALDASAKEPCYMTVKVRPDEVRSVKPDTNNKITIALGQKKWLPANFKLEIDGLPCTKVNKIDAIKFNQKVTEDHAGQQRNPQRVPGRLEYPNITFTLAQTDAQPWLDYFDRFKRAGECTPQISKNGSLSYLAPDNSTELFKLTFTDMCPRSITPLPPGSDGIKRMKIEMYCEDIKLDCSPDLSK